jgi:hypothetical protein
VRRDSFLPCGILAAVAGCSSPDPAGGPEPCVANRPCLGGEIGRGDGSPGSVTLTPVLQIGYAGAGPVDLAFDPQRPGDLWVLGFSDSSVHVGKDLDGSSPTWTRYRDPAWMHFMYRPPALAMGDRGFWATCGDNDNSQADETADGLALYFMGPALFTTDLTIFAKRTPEGRGSHYDMLHSTPFCRGIAHVEANAYWVFNAFDGSLDRYDFAADHGPGADDHADGHIRRYAAGEVKGGDDGTPSHVFYDREDRFLYVADTGHGRIVRLDTTSGTPGTPLPRPNEPLAESAMMEGTHVEVVVPPGALKKPVGLEVRAGLIYVTDAEGGTFSVFDKRGRLLRKLTTGLPPSALAGFTFGFDGKIWFVDRTAEQVLRIDP